MDTSNDVLTTRHAYLAMYQYLLQRFERSGFEGVGAVLGDLSLLEDGSPLDPAAWNDWLECIEKAKSSDVDTSLRLKSR